MSDLSLAPTTTADEKSTTLKTINIADIEIPEGGKPILERKMRVRRLDVFPGGVIGLHDHTNRPAILFVLRGSFTIHNSTTDEPEVVNEGEAVTEFGHLKHWAKNNSDKEPLALLTFDLLDEGIPAKMEPCPMCAAQEAEKEASKQGS